MKFRPLASVTFIALTLVACSSGSSGGGDTVPPGATLIRAQQAITWDAKSYSATPVDGKVTISLRDDSDLPHNLHLLDSDSVDKGISLNVEGLGDVHTDSVALNPGTYKVICTIPGHGNMQAELIVG